MGSQVAVALATLAAGLILLMVWAMFAPTSVARDRRRARDYERERDQRIWKAIGKEQELARQRLLKEIAVGLSDPRTAKGEPIDAMVIRHLRGGSRGQNGQAVGVRTEGPEV